MSGNWQEEWWILFRALGIVVAVVGIPMECLGSCHMDNAVVAKSPERHGPGGAGGKKECGNGFQNNVANKADGPLGAAALDEMLSIFQDPVVHDELSDDILHEPVEGSSSQQE